MKMSYLRGACGVTRWEGESNASVYKRCGIGLCANGVKCGAVEWMLHLLILNRVHKGFACKYSLWLSG